MTKYIKMWGDRPEDYYMVETREQFDTVMRKLMDGDLVADKVMHAEEVEMTEEEYRAIPAAASPLACLWPDRARGATTT